MKLLIMLLVSIIIVQTKDGKLLYPEADCKKTVYDELTVLDCGEKKPEVYWGTDITESKLI